MEDNEIIQIVARLRRLERKGREVKDEVEGIRALLKGELLKRGTDEIKVGRYRVRRFRYERMVLDAEGLARDEPELYLEYRKPQTVERLDVMG